MSVSVCVCVRVCVRAKAQMCENTYKDIPMQLLSQYYLVLNNDLYIFIYGRVSFLKGFPGGISGKEPACQC